MQKQKCQMVSLCSLPFRIRNQTWPRELPSMKGIPSPGVEPEFCGYGARFGILMSKAKGKVSGKKLKKKKSDYQKTCSDNSAKAERKNYFPIPSQPFLGGRDQVIIFPVLIVITLSMDRQTSPGLKLMITLFVLTLSLWNLVSFFLLWKKNMIYPLADMEQSHFQISEKLHNHSMGFQERR